MTSRTHCIHLAIAQGTLPWQPTKVRKIFAEIIFFVALLFRNVLEYRNGDGQLRSELNVATSYANTVMIDVVTPEKRLLIFVLCEKKRKHMHVRPII